MNVDPDLPILRKAKAEYEKIREKAARTRF
jgi:hypothetical protein